MEGKTEINADNYGGAPYCGADEGRKTDKEICESAYWTGGDLKSRACLWDQDRYNNGKNPCRFAKGEMCLCSS